MLVWDFYLEGYLSKRVFGYGSIPCFGIIRDNFPFLDDDAEVSFETILHSSVVGVKVFWSIIWAVWNCLFFVMPFMPLNIMFAFFELFMSLFLIVITSFNVGSLCVNGLLCHLLNVNKDIYDLFPWKKNLGWFACGHWHQQVHHHPTFGTMALTMPMVFHWQVLQWHNCSKFPLYGPYIPSILSSFFNY